MAKRPGIPVSRLGRLRDDHAAVALSADGGAHGSLPRAATDATGRSCLTVPFIGRRPNLQQARAEGRAPPPHTPGPEFRAFWHASCSTSRSGAAWQPARLELAMLRRLSGRIENVRPLARPGWMK